MQKKLSEINAEQGQALVKLARKTLLERFGRKLAAEEEILLADKLKHPGLQTAIGVFVTLKKGGRLRGCIGTLEGREPLVDGVRSNSVNAAFHDPRFGPLQNMELDQVSIEVSVLTEPQPLEYTDADDLITKLRPGLDGVTIRKGFAGATFLPQVWEQLPDPEDFLSHLCMKANMGAHAWRNSRLEVETYQVQHFEESHP